MNIDKNLIEKAFDSNLEGIDLDSLKMNKKL